MLRYAVEGAVPPRQLGIVRGDAFKMFDCRGKCFEFLRPDGIGRTHLYADEGVQDVHFREGDIRNAIHHHRVLQRNQIQPATATRSPGGSAELRP